MFCLISVSVKIEQELVPLKMNSYTSICAPELLNRESHSLLVAMVTLVASVEVKRSHSGERARIVTLCVHYLSCFN
jgi:hypothetical protein